MKSANITDHLKVTVSLILYQCGALVYWMMNITAKCDDRYTWWLYKLYNWLMLRSSYLDKHDKVWKSSEWMQDGYWLLWWSWWLCHGFLTNDQLEEIFEIQRKMAERICDLLSMHVVVSRLSRMEHILERDCISSGWSQHILSCWSLDIQARQFRLNELDKHHPQSFLTN